MCSSIAVATLESDGLFGRRYHAQSDHCTYLCPVRNTHLLNVVEVPRAEELWHQLCMAFHQAYALQTARKS